MEAVIHPVTVMLDVIHRESENGLSIPRLLDKLFETYDSLAPEFKETDAITSLSAVPGSYVEFRCEVRSVVRTRIAAYSVHGDKLLLFRSEAVSERRRNLPEVDVISLGCVIRDRDSRTLTPIVVKVFDNRQEIRKGHYLKVIGILTYMPSFNELLRLRGNDPLRKILNHESKATDPPGARRVHAMYYERIIPMVEKIPEISECAEVPFPENTTWCVLQ